MPFLPASVTCCVALLFLTGRRHALLLLWGWLWWCRFCCVIAPRGVRFPGFVPTIPDTMSFSIANKAKGFWLAILGIVAVLVAVEAFDLACSSCTLVPTVLLIGLALVVGCLMLWFGATVFCNVSILIAIKTLRFTIVGIGRSRGIVLRSFPERFRSVLTDDHLQGCKKL